MDVQCERCKTEYEFDDALVSGRGTTVKCTNCGHQFKIRPSVESPDKGSSERWIVTTANGQRLVFTTLRELQRAITNKQVGRSDSLARGNAPPRPLGAIAELEPFFDGGQRVSDRPPGPGSREATGVTAVSPFASTMGQTPSRPPPPVGGALPPVTAPRRPSQPPRDELPPARGRQNTLRPSADSNAAAPPPPAQRATPVQAPSDTDMAYGKTQMVPSQQNPPVAYAAPPAPYAPPSPSYAQPQRTAQMPQAPPRTSRASGGAYGAQPEFSSPLPPPTRPVRRQEPSYDDVDASDAQRMQSPSISDGDSLYPAMPRQRRVGGWVVAFVLLVGVSVIGYKVGQPYLSRLSKGPPPPAELDARAQQFLNDGEHALGDGNLELAKEKFDKASALAEKDPHVLLDLARLAAVRADVPWLRLRLLPPDAVDDLRATKQTLDDLSQNARKAADDAVAAAPDDPSALRAKVDALRIAGERDAARKDVARISANASQPETAYVLAGLDLAELDPLWPTVVDRLRVAAAGEGSAGRAQAALVYALARAGDSAGAKAALDKLSALQRPHPLVGALRAFVTKLPAKPLADAGAAAATSATTAVVDVNSLPRGGGGGGAPSGDSRDLMRRADAAKNAGDFARAKQFYEAVRAKDPNDSEALASLGDVARLEHDPVSAKGFYKQVLGVNPNYMPARIGLADVEFELGDTAAARRDYKSIVESFSEGTYPAYVKTRAEAAAPAPTQAPSSTAAPLTVPRDTPSDLPGTTPP